MLLEKTNLQQKLENFRKRQISEEEILEQVYSFLKTDLKKEEELLQRLQEGDSSEENNFLPDLLESNRIFHIDHIKAISIEYRLRFLSTKYFKAPLPGEALFEIKRLEKQHQTTLKGFGIMAPSKHFKLENADDPILFAPIGNGYFYLIHKWGKDLHPLRKIIMWPLKNFENLLIFTFLFSLFFTFTLREIFFYQFQSTSEFIILFMFTFKSMIGLLLFYGIALGKNFNTAIWKSKFYNHP